MEYKKFRGSSKRPLVKKFVHQACPLVKILFHKEARGDEEILKFNLSEN